MTCHKSAAFEDSLKLYFFLPKQNTQTELRRADRLPVRVQSQINVLLVSINRTLPPCKAGAPGSGWLYI